MLNGTTFFACLLYLPLPLKILLPQFLQSLLLFVDSRFDLDFDQIGLAPIVFSRGFHDLNGQWVYLMPCPLPQSVHLDLDEVTGFLVGLLGLARLALRREILCFQAEPGRRVHSALFFIMSNLV